MAPPQPKHTKTYDHIVYDIFLWLFTIITDLFFREIHPRSSWKIPRQGPVIFVAAPHANQFVDPLILMRTVRQDARRRIAFLIAEKSMKRKFVGFAAGLVGSVSVGRALDSKKPAPKGSLIRLKEPQEGGDWSVIEGVETDFTDDKIYQKGGLLVLPSVEGAAANAEIKDILSATEIKLKKPFSGDTAYKQLTGQPLNVEGKGEVDGHEGFGGTKFSVAPHVDQSAVYNAVFQRLKEGGCIGIFPEGGSHDRTELLPLKAGVAIMALGALAENPDCGVTIVPVGMNYFHAHKFRSRAVIEFGSPIEVEPRLVEEYKSGDRRGAIGELLDTVYQSLVSVTVTSPDYDTLMLIQAVRRLYNPKGKKLPLPMIVELNRRLVKGYTTYKDDPRIKSIKKQVLDYNKQLMMLNVRDHQVSYAKFSWYKVVFLLLYRVAKLFVLAVAVLPGLVLFAPVFIAGKIISIKKSREALAASTVKIQARDVIATWKILVSMALAPLLYTWYTMLLVYWNHRSNVHGLLPKWTPWWAVVIFGYIAFPAITFAALRFGEIGMDIAKSLRPLILSLNPSSSNTFVRLRKKREVLVEQITDVINELGPDLYPDFDHQRIVSDPSHPLHSPHRTPDRSRPSTPLHRREGSELDYLTFTPASPIEKSHPRFKDFGTSAAATASMGANGVYQSTNLPRNDSFRNIGSVGIFATRPGTPTSSRSRSRSRANSTEFKRHKGFGFTPMMKKDNGPEAASKTDMEEVSKRIHASMRERGRRRRSSADGSWIFDDGESGESENEVAEEAKKNI